LYHDPYIASAAYVGYPSSAVPVMPGLSRTPPASTYVVDASAPVYNNQFIQGEQNVQQVEALELITRYFNAVSRPTGATASELLDMFVDESMMGGAILVPGDPATIPYAGLYQNSEQIREYHARRTQFSSFQVSQNPTQMSSTKYVHDKGSVVVKYSLDGTAQPSNLPFRSEAIDYFQIVKANTTDKPRIARLTRFFDTWAVSFAHTSGVLFGQYATTSAGLFSFLTDLGQRVGSRLETISAVLAQQSTTIPTAIGYLSVTLDANTNLLQDGVKAQSTRVRNLSNTVVFLITMGLLNFVLSILLFIGDYRVRKNYLDVGQDDQKMGLLNSK